MSEPITHFVTRRDPPLEATLTTDGSSDPLPAGAAVTFSMRLVGSSVLKVSAASATVVSEPNNTVSYSWAAGDVDTAGYYVGWWTVTSAGKSVDTPEFLIHIDSHAPLGNEYLSVEEFKGSQELDGTAFADDDIRRVLVSASRALEQTFGSRWYTTAADEIRYYTPSVGNLLYPDEIVSLTQLATDDRGGTAYASIWTVNVDYVLEPFNAVLDGQPYRRIETMGPTNKRFYPYPRSVRLTGKFGWSSTPEAVKVCTGIVANKYLKMVREAPLGIITAFDGTIMRIARFNPAVQEAMAPYDRIRPIA